MNQRLRFFFILFAIFTILTACQDDQPTAVPPTTTAASRSETVTIEEPEPTAEPTAVPDFLAWEPLGDFALDDFPPDAPLVIRFNQPMKTATPQPLIFSPPARGEFTWSENDTVLTFTPDEGFETNRNYSVTLNASVHSRSGVEFAATQRWQVRTQNTPQISHRVPSSSTVAERQPSFELLFNRTMVLDSVEAAVSITPAVDYTLEWQDNTLSLSLEEQLEIIETSVGGWMGFSDKYWLTALVPDPTEKYTATFRHAREPGQKAEQGRYQVDFRGQPVTIAPQATQDYTRHFFAGAKRIELLSAYSETLTIEKFELAIDFGWFRFLTKPMLVTLNWLGQQLGSVGLAILVLTILVKLLVLPLGIKSYRSMAKMKILQPEMARLQERYKDDRQRFSIEMMEVYKREKISPLSGCLPLLAQIPIFFALYKVLYIGIEMRHAPFFGWIQDLSAPDPTNFFNLFGLLPWTTPAFLHIGAWPIMMGVSMFFLQKMSPAPTDPIQKSVITWMPVMFTIMLAPTMASGLIIYWTWSNLISMLQQYLVFRRIAKH